MRELYGDPGMHYQAPEKIHSGRCATLRTGADYGPCNCSGVVM